jgi:hypothetical protein
MKKADNDWPKIALLFVLFLMCIGLVALQIYRSETVTKLESALLSGLQFLISLVFSWVLSFWVFEVGHKEKQKKFALGAFRRIKEIERNIVRTANYVDDSLRNGDDLRPCMGVIKANLTNARDTVMSSIYDWSDIIEDEIEISAQIEKLEQTRSAIADEPSSNITSEEIEKLIQKLPPPLRQAIREESGSRSRDREAIEYLRQQFRENGSLDLRGFWQEHDGFMKEPDTLKVGDVIYIARGMTKNRSGAILAYDADGKSLGVITNRCSQLQMRYDVFAYALDEVFGKKLRPELFGGTPVEARVMRVDGPNAETSRRYFEVSVGIDKVPNEANSAGVVRA